MSTDPNAVNQELQLLEQVHMALGSAHKLDDFYAIVAGLLVAPDTFRFSRTFIFRYDEKQNQFQGKMALGARTAKEHKHFRREMEREQKVLRGQIAEVERESSEPAAIQQLYDLRFHSLWVQLLQGREEGTGLNAGFQRFAANARELPENHILNVVSKSPHTHIYTPGQIDLGGLEEFVQLPAVATRLKTRRGIHGILIADRMFEEDDLDQQTILRFQGLANHACITLENVELVEDLTVAATRMREVDKLKTNFLSIVSHELRTPLTSIIGFIHLLKQGRAGVVTQTQLDLLERVAYHSHHLQNMVNDILEIAEVESGGMVNVVPQAVDPLEVLWRVLPKVEHRRITRNVTIEPTLTGPVPAVLTDASALERIYYHLLDNAIKFIQSDGKVTVAFQKLGDNLEITIADTGIGIQPENLKQIFQYFYQVDYRLERAYSGMGIGLTVVKLLLDATGGTMRIESAPGVGSRFTLTYPLA